MDGDWSIVMISGCHLATWSSRGARSQRPPSYEVVRRRGEGHDPIHLATATMMELAQQADGLHPAEGLLDLLPASLPERIPWMSRGASVDRAAPIGRVLGHMRRDAHLPDGRDPRRHVEVLVAADRQKRSRLLVDSQSGRGLL